MKTERKQFMKITQKEFMQAVEALAEQKAAEKIQMMIGKAHPPGQPGPPNPDPSSPYEKGKSPHKLLAGGPSFDIGPGHGKVRKKALGFNKTRNNPNDREVEMIKEWLGGPRLPDVSGATSEQIRGRLKPFTHGTGYDKEGGSLRGVPDVLRKQLLIDAKA